MSFNPAGGSTLDTATPPFAGWPRGLLWLLLLLLSAALSWVLGMTGLPAALLLGPMVGGIVFGINGTGLKVPTLGYRAAQAVIGALVGAAITPTIFAIFIDDWLLFCGIMTATLVGAVALGWMISRRNIIPGATAIYGTSPGAASAMVMLGEAQGADAQLIAFMQYSRVLLVALAAALVARFAVGHAASAPSPRWFAAVDWPALATVLALAAIGQMAGRAIHLSAWALLGPMLLLSGLHAAGLIQIALPRWLLAASYALLGWHIGLDFRRATLRHASQALPAIIGAALALMAFCAGLAWCLYRWMHVDMLTAYLATSPGGMDTVAVIAASSGHVDMGFVMALQGVRLVFVIALAPALTRLVVRYSPHLDSMRMPSADSR